MSVLLAQMSTPQDPLARVRPIRTSSSHAPSPYHVARRSSTMERRKSILGSLRTKFSRKDSVTPAKPVSTPRERNMSSHPEQTRSPPTRRPNRAGMSAFTTPSTAPPPSYDESVRTSPNNALAPVAPAGSDDDPYAFLSSFDTCILLDDSSSMDGPRWREAGRALESITPIITSHDADGIDIFFLNQPDNQFYHNVRDASTVREIFSNTLPRGATPTGQRLWQILKNYLDKYESNPETTKPLNIIVITDGEPSDDDASPIIRTAKKLYKLNAPTWQVGIQFFQIGNDERAKKHLKELDDDLAEIARDDNLPDIVDTVPYKGAQGGELNADGILKCVLGSVNKRLDRKRSSSLHR
ncbi:MAG: hypothetical protein M1820_008611 [Bogoriella megaspora]|nr:MAG: hypothetical protein M1820_008611 [Bogoriella megaspora]